MWVGGLCELNTSGRQYAVASLLHALLTLGSLKSGWANPPVGPGKTPVPEIPPNLIVLALSAKEGYPLEAGGGLRLVPLENLGGDTLGRAIFFLGAAFLGAAFLGTAFLGATFLAATLGRENLGAAFLATTLVADFLATTLVADFLATTLVAD